MLLSLQLTVSFGHHCHANPTSKENFKRLRWYTAELSGYYDTTYIHLSAVDAPNYSLVTM